MTLSEKLDLRCAAVECEVIGWRRDLHQFPELSNREFRTAGIVTQHLQSLGLEVRTGLAHTGVVAVLRGSRPGPVVALRADMDALPVVETVDLPFASRERVTYNGQEVGVMHACGHDAHTAILMGVAQVLSELREEIRGTVLFVFQPAEEGAPEGEEGGAELMIRQGALHDPKPEAIFGLHVTSQFPVGTIGTRPAALMAAVDTLKIKVTGRQTHGAYPWRGVDPIVAAAQIVLGLQTVVSRRANLTVGPAIVTIGAIHGGVRNNIIPGEVTMIGTLRSLDVEMRDELHRGVKQTAEKIAESSGATAEVTIIPGYPITFNDPALTASMVPVLGDVAGSANVLDIPAVLGAEDFAFYQQKLPGMFFFLGTRPVDVSLTDAAPNHAPDFYVDESGLLLGLRAMTHLATNFLESRDGQHSGSG
ncbi:MAG: amidohydrolase [Acidobacteriota bacterium]